jgi:hypothetical protein
MEQHTTGDDDLYAAPGTDKEETVRIAFKMSKVTAEAWKAYCESRGVDMSHVLRRFIERELAKAEADKVRNK